VLFVTHKLRIAARYATHVALFLPVAYAPL
jgi:hypothetical protein